MNATRYTIAGVTDERDTCENCGRTDLKRTVVLDDGERFVFFGTACAARALGRTNPAKVARIARVKAQDRRRVRFGSWIAEQLGHRVSYWNTAQGRAVVFDHPTSPTGRHLEAVEAHLLGALRA